MSTETQNNKIDSSGDNDSINNNNLDLDNIELNADLFLNAESNNDSSHESSQENNGWKIGRNSNSNKILDEIINQEIYNSDVTQSTNNNIEDKIPMIIAVIKTQPGKLHLDNCKVLLNSGAT